MAFDIRQIRVWLMAAGVALAGTVAYAQSDAVVVQQLNQVSLNGIGLLNDQNGGLGYDAYNNSDPAFIRTLMIRLPASSGSAVAQQLRTRLLTSIIQPPAGDQNNQFAEARLTQLALVGQADQIKQMLDKLPGDVTSESLSQIYTAALFVHNDTRSACDKVETAGDKYTGLFWRQAAIACQSFNGKGNAVSLGIQLLGEDGHPISPEAKTMFLNLASAKDKDKNAAQNAWGQWLRSEALKLPDLTYTLPELPELSASPLAGDVLNNWGAAVQTKPDAEKLAQLSRAYTIMAAAKTAIDPTQWQALAMFGLTNHLPLPEEVMTGLLASASAQGHRGETVLLVLQALGEQSPMAVSPLLLSAVIRALNDIGMEEVAKQLALEALTIPSTPATPS